MAKSLRQLLLVVATSIALFGALPSVAAAVESPRWFWAQRQADGVSVKCTWVQDNPAGIVEYRIYRGTTSPAPYPGAAIPVYIGSPEVKQFTDTPPGPGEYYYRVVAFAADGSWASGTDADDSTYLGPVIFGHAQNTSGTPLPNIEVTLYFDTPASGWSYEPTLTAITDAEGDFEFWNLPAGSYMVQLHDPSGAHMDEFHEGSHQMNIYRSIHIAGDTSADYRIYEMDPYTALTGVIRSEDHGKPLAGAQVDIREYRTDGSPPGTSYYQSIGTTTTDAAGRYRYLVDPGVYSIYTSASDHFGRTTPNVTIASGQTASIDATLSPYYDWHAPMSYSTVDSYWHRAPVRMRFGAVDDVDGGPAVWYRIAGGASMRAGDTGHLLTTPGETAVEYWAIDATGNREETRTTTVRIDPVAPVSTAEVTRPGAPAGPARVTVEATDAVSGVGSTYVRVGGGAALCTSTALVSAPGTTAVEYWSVDRAGNTEAVRSVTVTVAGVPAPDAAAGARAQWPLRNLGSESAGAIMDADVDGEQARALAAGAESVTVAVIEGCIDLENPALVGRIWSNDDEIAGNGLDDDSNGYVDDVHGVRMPSNSGSYDTVIDDPTWGTTRTTALAGVIAANGAEGVRGLAPNAVILPVPVAADRTGAWGWSPWVDPATLARAIDYATDNGAEVICIGAFGEQSPTAVAAAIERANAAGVLVVSRATEQAAYYPACVDVPGNIVVGASDHADMEAGEWERSTAVDVVAPGELVPSASPKSYAGVFVDRAPYRAAYLSFSAERVQGASARTELLARTLRLVSPDTSKPVLIVDDTPYHWASGWESAGSRAGAHQVAAAAAGFADIDVWRTDTAGAPTPADLVGKVVVWVTGVDYPHYTVMKFDSWRSSVLSGFLDAGGSAVIVSGDMGEYQGIGWWDDQAAFYANYLGVTYSGESPTSKVKGVDDGELGGVAANQTEIVPDSPEIITPVRAFARPILQWDYEAFASGTDVAAAHVAATAALLRGLEPEISLSELRRRIVEGADLTVWGDGYELSPRLNARNAVLDVAGSADGSYDVSVTASAVRTNGNAGAPWSVTATVTCDGEPVGAGVKVLVFDNANGRVVQQEVTNAAGAIRVIVCGSGAGYLVIVDPAIANCITGPVKAPGAKVSVPSPKRGGRQPLKANKRQALGR